MKFVRLSFKVGLLNVLRIVLYSFKKKFYRLVEPQNLQELKIVSDLPSIHRNTDSDAQKFTGFGWIPYHLTSVLGNTNIINNVSCLSYSNIAWDRLGDFSSEVGDIKGVWEPARFDWLYSYVEQFSSEQRFEVIESILAEWLSNNKPYYGLNWKCGQECSIRIINILLTLKLIEKTNTRSDIIEYFFKISIERIRYSLEYAVAQDNNHGTSEAAALYIGSLYLYKLSGNLDFKKYSYSGRRRLEERVSRLIDVDGVFSQYSVNYHRLVLDTLSVVEFFRRFFLDSKFNKKYYDRSKAAFNWLYNVIDLVSRDAPNIGSNDGANLLAIVNVEYRDFYSSLEFFSRVFYLSSICSDKTFSLDFEKLTSEFINSEVAIAISQGNTFCESGGFMIFNSINNSKLVFRFPNFRFRPSQCDLLHIDFWVNGINLLRDCGTFSYNCSQDKMDYYGGIKSHNSISLDDEEPLRKFSRFLFLDWPKSQDVFFSDDSNYGSSAYFDYKGNYLRRLVRLEPSKLLIEDFVKGNFGKACIRFHLPNYAWKINGSAIEFEGYSLRCLSPVDFSLTVTNSFESRFYNIEHEIVEVIFTFKNGVDKFLNLNFELRF